MSQSQVARIREEELHIPTYRVREDPNPPLFFDWDAWVYPYPRQDEILRPRDEEATYHAVILENPYLKVTVLPELGGRLFSAYDKTVQREIYHKVDVIKPALIGLRGAWICGGIEFNFIKGHHVLTVSPVDHLLRENPDGSVSVTVGAMERASRACWAVTLTLHPDCAYIQADLKLYNRNRYRLDFYQWSNSSVVAREDLVLPYPTDYMISSGRHLYRFPIQGGADISRWVTTPIAHDFFAIGCDHDFMGAYYDDLDVGMVHYANHYEDPGKKYFTWGTHDAGRIWDQILTDTDIPYAEPQAGCVVDQSTFLFLQPHQVVAWREYWWGVHGMKGFVEVNDQAALNLAPVGKDKTLLAVNSTRPIEGASLRLLVNGEALHEDRFDVAPDKVYSSEIALPHAAWRYADVQLVLADAEGREVVRYHKPEPDINQKVELPAPFQPKVNERSSAEELAIAANEAEKLRDFDRAEALYHQALAADPGYARAHAHLGALYSRQGLYRQAYDELVAAVRRDPDLGLAYYHLGIVCRELGDLKAARDHFWATRLDPAFSAQAFYYLGEMALACGDAAEAEAFLRRSLDQNRRHAKAHDMLALALRKQGRAREAREVLGRVLMEIEPLDVLAQAELWRLKSSAERVAALQARIQGDVQVLLELAADYMAIAQWEEAIGILRTWPGVNAELPANPLLYYTLAYCYDKLGDQEMANSMYHLAAEMDPAYSFAHRLEELDILGRALEVNPNDARAWACLGTLLYALRRRDEAIEAWKRSSALEHNAVVNRNLGKALWLHKKDLPAARAEYELAIAHNAADYRLYADLSDLLGEMGAPAEERLALLERAPQHGRIQSRLAAALVGLKRWDQAIEVMSRMQFDPYEGESITRPAYYAAYIGRGLERYEQGDLRGALSDLEQALQYPRNLGVGKSHYAQDSKAYYWAGVVAESLDDVTKARGHWEAGASIRPYPQQDPASPREGYQPEARYYASLCLQKLGRAAEAARLF
jgi:tetratricopeptide (TPR) repeat protein